ncbi:nicotinate phosphoribosyltransferase [Methylocapsa aurea]|uniref:nicotinate phosphoribosyltransferase n=1 Tax=Methylocapsa aurea TaxID=663610 RepID=UPI00068BD849|nr:nicotinate phosphoribosyltransferase [Methylocapsa aurea]
MTPSGKPAAPNSISALFTDLYELTMLQAYWDLGFTDKAAFSLFARRLPPERNYLIACGLDGVIDALESLRFDSADIAYLSQLGAFSERTLERLRGFRFTGDVYAMAEGTPFFPNEPILEIEAPIGEAQIVETLVMNQIGLQTMLASKAARVVEAARGRPVMDFGSRRAQGLDAALKGARAFHLAGVASTSNVMAGQVYGMPVSGTIAHSFIEACPSELEAFRAFVSIYPQTTLLIDTYDTLQGARNVVKLAAKLGAEFRLRAVRLDSGDLSQLSRGVRDILDGAGLNQVQIVASGGLDEYKVDQLLAAKAPIDSFGVGTDMSISADAPALDLVYKLTEYANVGRMKLAAGKRTLPGRKQIFRALSEGVMTSDILARSFELEAGVPLLECVMRNGRRLARAGTLSETRLYAREKISQLPAALRSLRTAAEPYGVFVSPSLRAYEQEVSDAIAHQAGAHLSDETSAHSKWQGITQ